MEVLSYDFPGFNTQGRPDTATHEVVVGTIEDGGTVFTVTLRRHISVQHLDFLVFKIAVGDKLLWQHRYELGVSSMLQSDVGMLLVLADSGSKGKIHTVTSFQQLLNPAPIGVRARLQLKMGVAEALGREYRTDNDEKRVVGLVSARHVAAIQAAKSDEIKERQEKRIQKVKEIVLRGRVECWTMIGGFRWGYAVVGNEWEALSNNTHCVEVASVENGTIGAVIAAFQVVKVRGQNPTKGNLIRVTNNRPAKVAKDTSLQLPSKTLLFEVGDDFFPVIVFPSMDAVREARNKGLNAGTYVTVETSGTNWQVFAVRKEGIHTLGEFAPIN